MNRPNYRKSNGCWNCKFHLTRNDDWPAIFCNLDNKLPDGVSELDVQLIYSILKMTGDQILALGDWESDHAVALYGICDNYCQDQ